MRRLHLLGVIVAVRIVGCDTTEPPAPPSGTRSSLTVTPVSLTAGTGGPTATATITVTALTSSGKPVKGATVLLSASGDGNALVQPEGPTNEKGVASGSLSSTVAGVRTVRATMDGILVGQAATLTVTAAEPDEKRSTLTAGPLGITASSGESAATVTVIVRDTFGNPVRGATVVLSASGTGHVLIQPPAPTGEDGVAAGRLSSTRAGPVSISATADGVAIAQTAEVAVAPAAVDRGRSGIMASPTVVQAGTGASILTVTARDAFGNPVEGAGAVLVAARGVGHLLSQPERPTLADGVATGTFRSTFAGTETISAIVAGVTLQATVNVSVLPGPVSVVHSNVLAEPTVLAVGEATARIGVTARDEWGNAVPGARVVLSSPDLAFVDTLRQPAGTTGADGLATGALWPSVAGSITVRAEVNGAPLLQTATVTARVVRPVGDGLAALPGVPLPLTRPSALSMQRGSAIQLEVWPPTPSSWSTSDGSRGSVTTNGRVGATIGSPDPDASHEFTVTASAGGAAPSIRVNSYDLRNFPRLITLVWRPVAGAATYEVIVQYGSQCTTGTAVCANWAGGMLGGRLHSLAFAFPFFGSQPGRWWVIARDATGREISTSEVSYFGYGI